MEGWPRIPNQNSASSSRPKATIPAPGTVVMASVEEELGDGVYSLRWGGNRIAVTSRSPLKTGQSLILKAETNAEGKPTLVVQGPALPEPGSITGRVIYGPGKNRANAKQQTAAENAAASRDNHQPGSQIAAGTSRANVIQAPTPTKPVHDLIGAVLEPLPEFEASVKLLEEAVKEEKERLEEKAEKEQKKAEAEKRGEQTQDADTTADENAAVHDRRARPVPGRHSVHPPAAGGGAAPTSGEAAGGQPADAARPPVLDQSGRPIPPAPAQTPERPAESAPPPRAETPLPQRPDPAVPPVRPPAAVPPATVISPPPTAAPSVPASEIAPSVAPPVLPESAGPVVPEPLPAPLPQSGVAAAVTPPPASTAPDQTLPPAPAPLPHGTPPRVPEPVPAAPPQGAAPATSAPPSPVPGPITLVVENAGPVVPEPLPAILPHRESPVAPASPPPAQPPSAPVTFAPENTGPTLPEPIPVPAQAATPQPQPPAAPIAPAPAPEPAGPAVPQPLPAPLPRGDVPVASVQPPPPATTPTPIPVTHVPVAGQPQSSSPAAPEPVPVVVPNSDAAGGTAVSVAPSGPRAPAPVSPATATVPPEAPVPTPTPPQTPPPITSGQSGAPVAVVLPGESGPAVPDVPSARPAPPPEAGQPPAAKSGETPLPPETPPPPTTRQSGNYGPSRSDTDTIRARQATLPSADRADLEAVEARTGAKPEVVLKEALTQMVKAAELPLAGGTNAPPLSLVAKPPPETLDKAAELLLQAAGVTPDEQSVAAARALIKQNVNIDRDSVQTVLTAAAEAPDAEQEAVMNAAARLLSKDIPVSPPLVAGLVDVLDRRAGTHALMQQAQEALAIDPDNPQAQKLMEAAGELLDMLHVDLDSPDAPEALERYLSTFGRETLGKAVALVETAAQAVLEGSPELQRLDQAISAVLTELTDELAQAQTRQLAEENLPATPDPVPQPSAKEPATPVQVTPLPARPPPSAPINAYLNAPRAFDIAEALKNLPPMPQNITINTPVPQEIPPPIIQPLPAPVVPNVVLPPDGSVPQGDGSPPPQQPPATPATPTPTPAPMPPAGEGFLMPKLDSLFQIPGLNRPELELLKPSGFMERFLQSSQDGPDAQQVKEDARTLLRQLTSEDARHVERGLREVKTKSGDVLRETAARLQEREAEVIRSNTVLNRLADAATSLRDLGRQLLAVKAENLAGQDREPGVMLAEVPFKLHDDAGEGRMQMFYRRRKDKGEGWNNRVILDLNTTRMGPVLGDMRFFGQDMVLNMFVEHQETAKYLEASGHDLVSALAEKGFRVKARFMVLPPRHAPELRAERPVITGEDVPVPLSDGGRLDIKG